MRPRGRARGGGRAGAARAILVGAALVACLIPGVAGASAASLPDGTAGASAASLAPWTGSFDIYRPGTFTTQATWLWCTAADVQIARNIVRGEHDHTATAQRRYFDWMRAHDRYAIPVSDGVDPAGWSAGLARFVDPRYRVVTSGSFANALRSAVRRLRETARPVALLVDHGNHGWLLTGFAATADPATTPAFAVTSVRVVGPLYGLQSRGGYDMPPDSAITPQRLASFLAPFHYARTRMTWEGRWVTIQAIPG